MAPLTWRNVDAPSFSGVNDALRLAATTFNTGFDVANRTLGDFQEANVKADSNKLITDILKYRDPVAYEAALSRGEVGAGIDPRNLSAGALDFMAGHNRQLLQDQGIVLNNQGTGLINDSRRMGNANTALQLNQNVALNDDFFKDRARVDEVRGLVSDIRTKTSNPNDAIKVLQGRTDLDPRVVNAAIGEFQANGNNYYQGIDPVDQMLAQAASLAPPGLITNESGGSLTAQNDAIGSSGRPGHIGRVQFGADRLDEAKQAGVIPADMTNEQFMASPEAQARAEAWHWNDIQDFAANDPLIKSKLGQTINGVTITPESIKAMAHIGGKTGMRKFIESNGEYNPSDSNGASLSDYGKQFGGTSNSNFSGAPTSTAIGSAPIDITKTQLQNLDGTVSTESTITIEDNGKFVNIPTVVGGQPLSDAEAEDLYRQGQNNAVGRFSTLEDAETAAQERTATLDRMLSQAADPAAIAPTVSPNAAAQTIANTATVDTIFNQNESLDREILTRPHKDEDRGSTVKRLKEGVLSSVPESAITEAIEQTIQEFKVSPDIAGALVANSVESRDLAKKNIFGEMPLLDQIFGARGEDEFGKSTEGTRGQRINMDLVRAAAQAYRDPETGKIGEGVGRLANRQASATVPPTMEAVQTMAAQVEQEWLMAQSAAKAGRQIDLEAEYQKYITRMTAIQQLLKQVSSSGIATANTDALPTN